MGRWWPLLVRLFLFLLPFAGCKPAEAQHNGFTVINYNEAYLPQNSVGNACFDRYGFLWINTQAGLVRFDGVHFHTFTRRNTRCLGTDRIKWIDKFPEGDILFQDAYDNIFRIDGIDSFTKIQNRNSYWQRRLNSPSFTDSRSVLGNILSKGNDLVHYYGLANKDEGYLVYRDKVHHYYLYREKDLWQPVKTNFEIKFTRSIVLHDTLFFVFSDGSVARAHKGRLLSGKIKLPANLLRLSCFDPNKNKANVLRDPDFGINAPFIIADHKLVRLYVDKGSLSGEILGENLPVENINRIVYDSLTRNFVLSSLTNGLYILKPRQFTSRVIPSVNRSRINNIYSQILLKDGSILASNGIIYTTHSYKKSGLSVIEYEQIFLTAKKKNLGGSQEELRRIFAGKGQKELIAAKAGNIAANYEGHGDSLWLVSNSNLVTMVGSSIVKKIPLPVKLHGIVTSLYPAASGTMLLGTSKGLYGLSLSSGKCALLSDDSATQIRDIRQTTDGNMWVTTYGTGFYKYNQGKLLPCPLDPDKHLSYAHTIIDDDNGYYWLSTNKGLFQVAQADLNSYLDGTQQSVYYHRYDKDDGFATNEFNGGNKDAVIKLPDGTLSFVSLHGLVQFNPKAIKPLVPDHNIFIEQVFIDSQLSKKKELILPPTFEQVKVKIATPYFGNIGNQHLEYNIKGLDQQWNKLDDDGIIVIKKLPHGNYVLQVRKMAGFGRDRFKYAYLKFKVKPHFYETLTFGILILLITALLFIILFRWRNKSLIQAKRKLEDEVVRRTEEQHNLIGELKESLHVLEVARGKLFESNQKNEKLSSLIVHDLKSPLKFIDEVSSHLSRNVESLQKNILKKLTQDLSFSVHDLFAYTDNLMHWIHAQRENFVVKSIKINVGELLKEVTRFYEEVNNSRNNQLLIDCPEDSTIITDPNMLKVILRNLIDNAIKYTMNGKISLIYKLEQGRKVIYVTDTGRGMNDKMVSQLNLYFTSNEDLGNEYQGNFGIKIIKDFVSYLNAAIEIKSTINGGTQFKLSFTN